MPGLNEALALQSLLEQVGERIKESDQGRSYLSPDGRAYVLAIGEFSHIIAGSVDCAFVVQIGGASFSEYLLAFFIPTLLGNVLGGTTLVALLNYGQVASELQDKKEH